MPLTTGTRLGSYEILSLIGVGGMGEVYRAKDTKLGRDVAIKVLPEAFVSDHERVAQFEREAKVLASLNHPNIAALHGMEQTADRHFLIMELVEGETLAERLRRGAVPVGETLQVVRQMAEALEAAHEKPVVHRDLKPANVKITPDGKVKVLDFGLAKAMEPAGAALRPESVTHSPTLSAMATRAGMILGTAAYMSPEQAEGRPVDHRSDIFSFGAVLYELLTGRQAFQGETAAAIMASVIVREPDLAMLPPNLSARLAELLKRCLEKHPRRRWQAAGDLRAELEAIQAAPRSAVEAMTGAAAPHPWPLRRLGTPVAVALVVGGAIAGSGVWIATRPAAPRVVRTTIASSGAAALSIDGNERDVAITPDGSRVVYVGNNGAQLFVRALDALEPAALASGAVRGPFVSPDGQWVGFFENLQTLKKVAISGGPAITVASVDGSSRGATWLPDDTIIFGTLHRATGLQRVSANSDTPAVLTKPDRARGEADHLYPEVLPGGRAVLFTITAAGGGLDAAQIAVLDLHTNTFAVVVRGGSHAHYVSSGHLVYAAGGALRAVPFDLSRLTVRGPAATVVSRVATSPFGSADFGIGDDGTLMYVDATGTVAGNVRTLTWVDRSGKEEPITAPPRPYIYPRVSPDGTRVAVYLGDQGFDIWIWDLRRLTLQRLTVEPGLDVDPIWTPDGRRLIFDSDRAGQRNLWWQAADGTGVAERLTTSDNQQIATAISPDGRSVVFTEVKTGSGPDVMQMPLTGDRRPVALLQTPLLERNGSISPDGRWLAYESTASGRYEIYVRPYPNTGEGQLLISTAGGTRPAWAPNGRELFFAALDGAMMRVPVGAGSTWVQGVPTKMFAGPYFLAPGNAQRTYDIAPDGQRFLMIKTQSGDQPAAPPSIVVVQHFDEELKRLAPRQ